MQNEFSRTELLLGEEALKKLKKSSVAVFGIGGVGSYSAEALARCGIGKITLFDHDVVNITNINRQLIATHRTIGLKKVDVMKNRILDINPACTVRAYDCFYSAQNAGIYDLLEFDYIIDAIDTVSSKLILIENAKKAGVQIISSMGAGNKLDPVKFEVSDIYKTSVCPLARVMRKELKARGINSLKVVYSKEPAIKPEKSFTGTCLDENNEPVKKRCIPASVSFVPPVCGFILASEVIKDLLNL